ncbi:AMP-binding protein [Rugosimonospora africana]|uniref:AMP-binding protein n=2 Tax=Rugosimonospora africana TaxID=556532 RepID=A0A8J3R409_9ACTN|nr:AMP-binding protein [Rugosimonospora africana]
MSFVSEIRAQIGAHGDSRHYTFVDRLRAGRLSEARLTFREIDLRARAIAAMLHRADLIDQTVLLLYPSGLEFVTVFLGCLYARVIAVPAPLPDAGSHASSRVDAIARNAGVRTVLTDAAHRAAVVGRLATAVGPAGRVVATDSSLSPAPGEWEPPELLPETIAYLQYTSGSTSDPKGVAVSHGNLVSNETSIRTLVGERTGGQTAAGWLPHYHDMGLVGLLLQPLFSGTSLVFTSPTSFVMRPEIWLQMMDRHRADLTVAPDFGYAWCARRVTDAQLEHLDLSSVRIALNGAEPVRASTLREVAARLGPCGFDPQAWSPVYGLAEATLLVSGARRGATIRRFDASGLEHNRAVPSPSGNIELTGCGRPVGATVRIVEPEQREILPDGHVGEIWVQGGGVAAGHFRERATSEPKFRAHTRDGTGPFLRTGDLGFQLDGELYVTGRCDDLIIINGRNIYPQDIEATARKHPATETGAAFGMGPGQQHLVLVQEVRPRGLTGTSLRDLALQIRDDIVAAFGVPSVSVLLVRVGAIEKTTSGKVRRGRTRRLFHDGGLETLHSEVDPRLPTAPGLAPTAASSAGTGDSHA